MDPLTKLALIAIADGGPTDPKRTAEQIGVPEGRFRALMVGAAAAGLLSAVLEYRNGPEWEQMLNPWWSKVIAEGGEV